MAGPRRVVARRVGRLVEYRTRGPWAFVRRGCYSSEQACDKPFSLDSEAVLKLASAMPAGGL
eukprot:3491053-Lingulodinium_polyedra.AAC.1